MKTRFTTVDLIASVTELREMLLGMRVNQVYDVDSKTYLIKFGKQDEKATLLLESGIRLHLTEFERPKNPVPSGFTMKLRKHLKNKRLESIQQVGVDRIVDLQFGINEATYHLILEVYDRGNIVLTDLSYCILNILRPRASGNEDVKFVVREKYPLQLAKTSVPMLSLAKIDEILKSAKLNDNVKKCLNPHVIYGPAVIDHILVRAGFPLNCQLGKDIKLDTDLDKLFHAVNEGENIFQEIGKKVCKGYIVLRVNKVHSIDTNTVKESEVFEEFHPILFEQHQAKTYKEYQSFNKAVDMFFSSLEGQKIEQKMLQKEKDALKKLENIKKDHEKRMHDLQKNQLADSDKAQLIEMNLDIVDKAILIIRSAVANQIGWSDIWNLVTEAQDAGDEVAKAIKKLKLDSNHFTMLLYDPYNKDLKNASEPQLIDIDLDLTAYGNARKYYDLKKHAAKKEQRTIESSGKVYKNAEKKTRLALKEVAVTSSIIKARKIFWFEKFFWFISSENYLVIAGRDSQQNELIVKRYMKPGDIYVHADIHGASSVVIKNPTGGVVPPKTQNEAGTMAVCYSAAWEAKVATGVWWVYHHQVSKTAPSGEYLSSGSFIIRGKKNYLPPGQLVLGFGFMFKLDEDSLEGHANERRIIRDEDHAHTVPDEEEEIGVDISDSEEEKLVPEQVHIKQTNEEDEEVPFPDTEVKTATWNSQSAEDNVDVFFLGDGKPVVLHEAATNVKQRMSKKVEPSGELELDTSSVQQQSPKRGQKSKLRKIKEKYKDQDEEERRMRMEILASAGGNLQKEFKGKKGKKLKDYDGKKNQKASVLKPVIAMQNPTDNTSSTVLGNDVNGTVMNLVMGAATDDKGVVSDDEICDTLLDEDTKTLSSLTGKPVMEDTLIFAIPVCAPYSAILNYKYKVKIMPGTARRGKASKTALLSFLHDKLSTVREKDLLKSVKDQDISRNFPGKVKLVVPSIAKLKK